MNSTVGLIMRMLGKGARKKTYFMVLYHTRERGEEVGEGGEKTILLF